MPTARKKAENGRSQHAPNSSKGSPDAIALLRADHATVRALLKQCEEASSDKVKRSLFAKIELELLVHATIEEEIFYPAYFEAVQSKEGTELYYEAHEEHASVERLLDLMPREEDEDVFAAQCTVLREQVQHHAKEEEDEMFPEAREVIAMTDLKLLGAHMKARKEVLMEGGVGPLRQILAQKVQAMGLGGISKAPASRSVSRPRPEVRRTSRELSAA